MTKSSDGLFDLDFRIGDSGSAPAQRSAYRAAIQGIQLRIEDDGSVHDVLDVSAAGCSAQITAPHFYDQGRLLKVQLEVRGRTLIKDLVARVVRVTPHGVMACSFQNMTRHQEFAMDKFVLEIQKRIIMLHKKNNNND